MACKNHQGRDGTCSCIKCGCQLCDECRTDLEEGSYCPQCLRKEVISEQNEIMAVKRRIKRELIFIFVGFVIGAAILFSSNDKDVLMYLLPFVFASLVTILRRIGRHALDSRNWNLVSAIFILFYAIIMIILSPIIFFYRVIRRILDYRKMSEIYAGDTEFLHTIDAYVAYIQNTPQDAGAPSMSLASDDEEYEVNFDAQASRFVINNNGEAIRDAMYR